MYHQLRSSHVTLASVSATVLVLLVFLLTVAVPGVHSAGTSTESVDTDQTTAREGGNFTVAVNSTNSPVVEGESLRVSVIVENTGRQTDTQEVALSVGEIQRDSREVTLEDGQRTTVSLTWATSTGDAGNYTASITTANDSVRPDVRVNAPSDFSVTVDSTNSPILQGEDLKVTALVENGGGREANNVEINLTVDSVERDSTDIILEPDEVREVTLVWQTEAGDSGEYEASVVSENGTDTTPVQIRESATFAVRDLKLPSQVTAGEQFTVSAVVENTGEYAGETEVDLVTDKDDAFDYDSRTFSLSSGELTTVEMVVETERGDAGTYTITLVAGNTSYGGVNEIPGESSATGTVVVNDPPTVQELDFIPCNPDCNGDPITVALAGAEYDDLTLSRGAKQHKKMIVPNTSDSDGEVASYAWRIDGEPAGSGPSLEYSFAETGEYELALTVIDDEGASTTARVNVIVERKNEPPTVSIGGVWNNTVGEETTVTAEATDPDGDITTYTWEVDGKAVSESRTLEYSFDEGGEHVVVLTVTDDDGAERTVNRTVSVAVPSADGNNGEPSLLFLLMGLVTVGAIGTAGYFYVRFRQVTGDDDEG